jgi:iron complex outermembrane receptor protein
VSAPRWLAATLLGCLVGAAQGQTADDADLTDEADAAELAALLETLEQETAIVTKTRMNRDFVPGMVSVLDAASLNALGVRTVGEALAHIPGVQAELDGRGNPTARARGVYFPFNSGSIQILLNGLPIGREDIGSNGAALFLPIAHVERLEFVRGPGSVLYGDFAFQGLLNILTWQDGRSLQAGSDSHGARSGHWLHSGRSGDWRYSSSLAALYSDSAVLPTGRLAGEHQRSGILQLANGGLSLIAQGQLRDLGTISGTPPDAGFEDSAWSVAASYQRALGEPLGLRVHAQYLDNRLFTGVLTTPQGSVEQVFEGSQLRGGLEFDYRGWSRQHWLFGVEHLDGDIDLATFRGVPAGPGMPPTVLRISGERRVVSSLFAQNQISLSDDLQLTLGVRHDDNRDIGSRFTPRASLVWQAAANHVIKLQRAQGHRAPTFFEQYSNPPGQTLDFEVNTTSELSWIHRRPGRTLRATVFRLDIDDMIFLQPMRPGFGNVASARSQGIELEWSQRLAEGWTLDAHLSHADARDNRNPALQTRDIDSTPNWIGHLGLQWQPASGRTLGLSWNHVDQRESSTIGDGAYDRVDLSARIERLWHANLDLRLGVDNLLDQRTEQIFTAPNGSNTLPFRDRIWWAELRWRI